jgi:hypothetical protein
MTDEQAERPTDKQTSEPGQTTNRESHPNAAGPQGLAGDMGISSERTDFEGIEGTGTMASSQSRTDGEEEVMPDPEEIDDRAGMSPKGDVDKPDQTSPVSGVDRTVGEVQPDEIRHKHEFDPKRNPGH